MSPHYQPPFPAYLLPSFNFPFRRRQHSASSEADVPSLSSSENTTPSSSPSKNNFLASSKGKGILHQALQALPRSQEKDASPRKENTIHRALPNTLKCVSCSSDIALASQIVSKGFTGRHGRAYLVAPQPATSLFTLLKPKSHTKPSDLINTKTGRSVNRELLTGMHVVADVSCSICGTLLGWKYVDAKEQSQMYKIGKFILEMKKVVLHVKWEDRMRDDEGGEGQFEILEGKLDEDDRDDGDGVILFDSEDEDECEELFAGVWDPEVVAKRRGRRVVPIWKRTAVANEV